MLRPFLFIFPPHPRERDAAPDCDGEAPQRPKSETPRGPQRDADGKRREQRPERERDGEERERDPIE